MSSISRRRFLRNVAVGASSSLFPWSNAFGAGLTTPIMTDDSLARRKEYLQILFDLLVPTRSNYRGRINQFDKSWEDWVQRTGELPPDFQNMPSIPLLPDPLALLGDPDGSRITTLEQWSEQKRRIRSGFERWVFGSMPPRPDNLRSIINDTRQDRDATLYDITLEFGPEYRAKLGIELLVPPGDGPFPVFLTNHPRRRPWVNTAVRRGYVGCIYYALDHIYGTSDDSDPWLDIFTEYDFSAIGRWAWGAMRAVDFLHTHPKVDRDRIAISGHSKNSKQALLAAAFDERIKAVVPSRGNTGDQMPWRMSTDMFVSESLEEITQVPHWFHPRLRFFVGREDKLPVEQNLLLALVAPRGMMMSHAYMEHQGNVIGFESSFRSVREVYRFLGHEENLGLYQQPGEHPSSVEDVEQYFDFFDTVFGRKSFEVPRIWIHGYSFEQWKMQSGVSVNARGFPSRHIGDFLVTGSNKLSTLSDWEENKAEIKKKMHWVMGEEPPGVNLPTTSETRSRYTLIGNGWRGQLFSRPFNIGGTIGGRGMVFGDDLRGDLYYPVDPESNSRRIPEGTSWPVVVWLHPYCYSMGYSRYDYWGRLVNQGFAVMAFDQIGFGVRGGQTERFYKRYPKWSLMGKMVNDTRAAIDEIFRRQYLDTSRIYIAGYALGAKVGLYTAALDERIAGLTVSAGFAPLRLPKSNTEGIRHYSHIHGLLPKFGFFEGAEDRLPVDYDEIIAAIAPRPIHIIAPSLDRYNKVDAVLRATDAAKNIYNLYDASDNMTIETPLDFNRYPNIWRRQGNWLKNQAGL